VLTGTGLVVQPGVIAPPGNADHRALRWHAYLRDPWVPRLGFAGHHCLGTGLPATRIASPAARPTHSPIIVFAAEECEPCWLDPCTRRSRFRRCVAGQCHAWRSSRCRGHWAGPGCLFSSHCPAA
jgi:hypothetical protein